MITAEEKKTNECDWGITFLNPKSDGQCKKAKRESKREELKRASFRQLGEILTSDWILDFAC